MHGAGPLAEVGRGEWVALVERERALGAPAAAALLLRVISSFLGHAEAAGWIEASPLPRRARQLLAPPVPARERVLCDAELALDHVSRQTSLERTYDRAERSADLLDALARWQAHVAELVAEGAQVVALAERRRAGAPRHAEPPLPREGSAIR